MDLRNSAMTPSRICIDARHQSTTTSVSQRRESRESGVSCGPSHLQCLSSQSAVYFQRLWSASASFFLRGLRGTGEGVPPDLRLPESHEPAQGVDRTAQSLGQRLAWHAAFSLA